MRIETPTANIIIGKSTSEERSEAGGYGKRARTGGSAIKKGPAKLRIRLVLESMPEADSQITGKMAKVFRPGMTLKAPFRVKHNATRSRMGIVRLRLGGRRSHGISRQARKRIP
ncbi:hypothetical protein GCM10023063_04260 [Arthrobacter methylotrophus]|uniref:Uncharacterized protein n=1 Tax=Arthrobacter methylotrophus TaxID=121291 RepID=A0ABV5USW1_9MICC